MDGCAARMSAKPCPRSFVFLEMGLSCIHRGVWSWRCYWKIPNSGPDVDPPDHASCFNSMGKPDCIWSIPWLEIDWMKLQNVTRGEICSWKTASFFYETGAKTWRQDKMVNLQSRVFLDREIDNSARVTSLVESSQCYNIESRSRQLAKTQLDWSPLALINSGTGEEVC